MYSFHRYRSDYRALLKLGLHIMVGQLGNYNLIYGKLGLPAMGATGLGYVGFVLHGGRNMVGLFGRAVVGRIDDDGAVQVLD